MPLTVRCPGCGSNLSAPDYLAGQAVRCTKCRQPMNLPAVVDAEPVVPARPAPATPIAAPPARPAMKRTAFADDPDDRPRRPTRPELRRRSKLPVVLLAVGGGLALLLVGVGVLLAVLGDDGPGRPGDVFGGVPADRWTRETIPGTDCSVEIPGRADKGKGTATLNSDKGPPASIGVLAGAIDDPDGGEILLTASVMAFPTGPRDEGDGWVETIVRAGRVGHPDLRLVRRYDVQGRKAAQVFVREKGQVTVALYVADGDRTIVLQAISRQCDEHHPAVKRFVDSVRFAP